MQYNCLNINVYSFYVIFQKTNSNETQYLEVNVVNQKRYNQERKHGAKSNSNSVQNKESK